MVPSKAKENSGSKHSLTKKNNRRSERPHPLVTLLRRTLFLEQILRHKDLIYRRKKREST
jgi:hypothetical protein